MIMANMETNSEERKVIDNVLQRDDVFLSLIHI